MSSTAKPADVVEIPQYLQDPKSKAKYEKGRFLGKGGFAKCYEMKNLETGEVVACKVVPKSLLVKQNQREKMAQEINLHKSFNHPYVVKLFSYYDDSNFVYIFLELCTRRSLMELHKRRKAISEPETRYFMNQILLGVKYLHDNKIIHRDLKLGNIFLNEDMQIKLGDFGLATRIDYDGERKRTLCGTPNYIAPEVLCKKGHSFEVDIWSLGCILYTLLVGRPPFETHTLKDTYARIKKNEYHVPSKIGQYAKSLIMKLLQSDPEKRPNVSEILSDNFMTMGYLPQRLPVSCLTMAPRFDTKLNQSLLAQREPLLEVGNAGSGSEPDMKRKKAGTNDFANSDCHINDLHRQLQKLIASHPAARDTPAQEDEAEDPRVAPMTWIAKWVDYSDKYGFGYSLCDDSIGVVFNDLTKVLQLNDKVNIHYIDNDNSEYYYTKANVPKEFEKKTKLLDYFSGYMDVHLLKAGENIVAREGDELSRIPYLKTWFRTSRAIVLHLTNGTLQINFFRDHTKIIIDPLLGGVTFIDEQKGARTYSLELIEKYGCSMELFARLQYTYEKVGVMLKNSKSSYSAPPQTANYLRAHRQ